MRRIFAALFLPIIGIGFLVCTYTVFGLESSYGDGANVACSIPLTRNICDAGTSGNPQTAHDAYTWDCTSTTDPADIINCTLPRNWCGDKELQAGQECCAGKIINPATEFCCDQDKADQQNPADAQGRLIGATESICTTERQPRCYNRRLCADQNDIEKHGENGDANVTCNHEIICATAITHSCDENRTNNNCQDECLTINPQPSFCSQASDFDPTCGTSFGTCSMLYPMWTSMMIPINSTNWWCRPPEEGGAFPYQYAGDDILCGDTVEDGECGTSPMTCLSTTAAIDLPDTATAYLWVCPGTNYQLGGRDAFCEIPNFCGTVTDVPPEECEALMSIYNNNGGIGWVDQAEWGVSTTVCSWYGVGCACESTGDGICQNDNTEHVELLDLPNWNSWLGEIGLTGDFGITTGNLNAMKYLYLWGNQLTSFANTGLASLQDLSLGGNRLTSFPTTSMPSLITLSLNNNQITNFTGIGLNALTSLNIESNGLISFDGAGMNDIQELYLRRNALPTLSSTGINTATGIDASYNQLTTFTNTGLTALDRLTLDHNQLTSFSGTGFGTVRNLYLNNNALTYFDGTGLTSLEILVAGYNLLGSSFTKPSQNTNYSDLSYNCFSRSKLIPSVPGIVWLDIYAPSRWEQRNPLCPAFEPDPPTGLTAAGGQNGQIPITWNAPVSNGGSAITDYVIEYKKTADATWTTFVHTASIATTATLTGLTNCTSYDFRVFAVNSIGTSLVSNIASATPGVLPTAPNIYKYTPKDRQVTLFWSSPSSDGGSPIIDYLIEYKLSAASLWTTYDTASTDLVATFPSTLLLTNGSVYNVRVSAKNNSLCVGTASPIVNVIPRTPATITTTNPVSSITQNTALGGGKITSTGGRTILGSGLEWDLLTTPISESTSPYTDDGSKILNTLWTSTMTGLIPHTQYHVRAWVLSQIDGTQELHYGSEVNFTTLAANLTASAPTPNTATINSSQTFTSTITNNGTASTGAGFNNFFQIASAAAGGGTITDKTSTPMTTLAGGATNTTTVSHTFTTAGTYSIRACADKSSASNAGTITESNEGDNCSGWTDVVVTNAVVLSSSDFVTTWKTDNAGTSNSTSITIPTTGGGYNYSVDWNNDGVFEQTGITGNVTHDFGTAGTYTIRIKGTFPRIYFNGNGDKSKLLQINQWGTNAWTSMENAFSYCNNLNGIISDIPNLSGVTDMSHMFAAASLFNQPIGSWNTSAVTNMSNMFGGATAFNQPIGSWNTSAVTNMFRMFSNATAFNQPLSGWERTTPGNVSTVSNVTNMSYMFSTAPAFNQPIGTWNTSSVTNMSSMFWQASAFNQPIGTWNTSSVTNMSSMFREATAFNQPLSGWERTTPGNVSTVSNVTNMGIMFQGAYAFNNGGVDTIKNWNTSAVTDMSAMFNTATAFNQPIGTWNTSSVINMFRMFGGATAFNQNIGSWNVANVLDATDMFKSVTLSTANYDALLMGWDPQVLKPSVPFSGGNSKYCLGEASRTHMVSSDLWTITDAGRASGCVIPNLTASAPTPNTATINSSQTFTSTITNNGTASTGAGFNNFFQIASAAAGGGTITDKTSTPMTTLAGGATNTTTVSHTFTTAGTYSIRACADKSSASNAGTITESNEGDNCSGWTNVTVLSSSDFVTTWKTDNAGTSNSTSITIPTTGGGGYSYKVDWNNDGDFLDVGETTLNTGPITHDFGTAGTYTIRITGAFPRIFFNDGGDKLKILRVDQWGTNIWTSMQQAFRGCANFDGTAVDIPVLTNVINMSGMFVNATAFNGDISGWNTSAVTDMAAMFYGATAFNGDISGWNTSAVTDMSYMFAGATSFNQTIGGWNTSAVTNMSGMFVNATAFNANISGWNTGFVIDMSSMFYNATSFNQPIGTWNTSAVTNMSYMFYLSSAFNSNISGWERTTPGNMSTVSHVTNMSYMFAGATLFNQPIGTWDTSAVTNMSYMFYLTTAFNGDISGWNTSAVTNMSFMLYRATTFDRNIGLWNTSAVTNMSFMLGDATSFDKNIGSWNVVSLTNASSMFDGVTLSTANYDALLMGWDPQVLKPSVPFSGGNSKYCLGEASHIHMTSSDLWTITDAGLGCTGPNLTASVPTPNTATTNSSQTFTSTITNNGTASTGAGFNNFFQIASAAAGGGTITDKTSTPMTTLAAGATNTTTVSHIFTTPGTYSIRACADKSSALNTGTIAESNEGDNCSGWTDVNVIAPPPTPTGLAATPSTCGNNWLNISWNASAGATNYKVYRGATLIYDGPLLAYSDIGLTLGTTYSYTITASNAGGTSAVSSPAVSGTVSSICLFPNLTASVPTPNTATTNSSQTFTSTITNNGTASTGAGFNNFFQIASAAAGGGTITDKTSTPMTTLAAGATNTTTVSHIFTTPGTYSIRACADKSSAGDSGTIIESSNEGDNCGGWTDVAVISTHTVTPSSGANGTISPATVQTVNHNTVTTFTITPSANYVASVGGTCGGTLVGTTYTTSEITADCTVIASFALITVTVTATTPYTKSPGEAISFDYNPVTNLGSTQCKLLNYNYDDITAYPTTNPIIQNAPSTPGLYSYYIRCRNTIENSIFETSNQILVNVSTAGTDSLGAANCTIEKDQSTCNTTLFWNTVNPIGTSQITTPTKVTPPVDLTPFVVATANSGFATYPISHVSTPIRRFFLYNNFFELAQATPEGRCITGTTWDGTKCAQQAGITGFNVTSTGDCDDDGLTLKWDPLNNATNYKVLDASNEVYNGNGTQVTDTGLDLGGTYLYTIIAYDTGGAILSTEVASGKVADACGYTITSSAGADGTINPNGETDVSSGGSQAYTITASTGHHIADVLVDGSSIGAMNMYTFSNISDDHTISATFSDGGAPLRDGCFSDSAISKDLNFLDASTYYVQGNEGLLKRITDFLTGTERRGYLLSDPARKTQTINFRSKLTSNINTYIKSQYCSVPLNQSDAGENIWNDNANTSGAFRKISGACSTNHNANGYYYYETDTNPTEIGKLLTLAPSILTIRKPTVLYVVGADIQINNNILYSTSTGDTPSLVIIAQAKDGHGGNIYVHPDVTNINATLIADGALMNGVGGPPTTGAPLNLVSNADILDKRLLINGKLFTYNTRGGSLELVGGILSPINGFIPTTTNPLQGTCINNTLQPRACDWQDAAAQDLERFRWIPVDPGNPTCSLHVTGVLPAKTPDILTSTGY